MNILINKQTSTRKHVETPKKLWYSWRRPVTSPASATSPNYTTSQSYTRARGLHLSPTHTHAHRVHAADRRSKTGSARRRRPTTPHAGVLNRVLRGDDAMEAARLTVGGHEQTREGGKECWMIK